MMSTLQEVLQLNFLAVKGSVATFVVAAYMKSVPMIYKGQEIGYDKESSTISPKLQSTGLLWMHLCWPIKDAEKVLILSNLTNSSAKHLLSPALKAAWKDAFSGA
jgi:hypothetical protein